MRFRNTALWFGVVLWLVGCAPRQPLNIGQPVLPEDLMAWCRDNFGSLEDLKGFGLMTVEAPRSKSVYGIELFYLAPRRLKVVLKGTLGVEVGTLILNGDQFQMTSGSEVIAKGSVDDSPFWADLDLSFTVEELWESLLPLSKMDSTDSCQYQGIDQANGYYLFISLGNGSLRKLWIDPRAPVIRVEQWLDDTGRLISTKKTDKMKRDNGVVLPLKWRLEIVRNDNVYNVAVTLSSVKINCGVKPQEFNFSRP